MQMGSSVLYVAELTSGKVAAYGIPWNRARPQRAPTKSPLIVQLDVCQFRDVAVRDAMSRRERLPMPSTSTANRGTCRRHDRRRAAGASWSCGRAYVAVEVNLELVPRRRHAEHVLRDGDRVEVVTLVGGG